MRHKQKQTKECERGWLVNQEAWLLAFFRHKGLQWADAENLTQEAMRKTARHKVKEPKALAPTVAMNLMRDFWKERTRHGNNFGKPVPLDSVELHCDAGDDPAVQAELAEMIESVHAAIGKLPFNEQVVVELFVLAERTQKEVAKKLHLSVRTVHRRLARAVRRLQKELGAYAEVRT